MHHHIIHDIIHHHKSNLPQLCPLKEPLQQIPIVRTHIAHLRLLILGEPQIPREFIALPVLPHDTRGVDDAAGGTEADEPDADAVARFVEMRLILGEEGIGC